jgi:LPS sulfotransferase NodH
MNVIGRMLISFLTLTLLILNLNVDNTTAAATTPAPIALESHHHQLSQMRRFFVVAHARSGSGWLDKLLKSHSRIVCAGELINPLASPALRQASCHDSTTRVNWINAKRALDAFFFGADGAQLVASNRTTPIEAIGCKLLLTQFLSKCGQRVREYAQQHNIRIIHLIRRNVVREAVSWSSMDALAKSRGGWQQMHKSPHVLHPETREQLQITRNQSRFHANYMLPQFIESSHSLATTLFAQTLRINRNRSTSTRPIDVHRIYYEDLAADPQHNLLLLQLFLGVEPETLHSSLLKIHRDDTPIESMLSNAQQFIDYLRGTPYAHWLC